MGNENKAIAITKEQAELVTSFDEFGNLNEALIFCKQIAQSSLSPLKSAEDVLSAMLTGKELGFGPMASIANIYPIKGKASAGIHVITALLLRAGVTTTILEDYTPLYQYKDESNVYQHDEAQKRDDFKSLSRSPAPVDYRTTVCLERQIKQPDGTYKTMKISSSFSMKDAEAAEFTTKDNWQHHPKAMLRARAISIGGRIIADDVLLGLYETSELTDILTNKESNTIEVPAYEIVKEVTSNAQEVVEPNSTE